MTTTFAPLLALVRRDLVGGQRRPLQRWGRVLVVLLTTAPALAVVSELASGGMWAAQRGATSCWFLVGALGLSAALLFPAHAVNALAAEREDGTLELMRLAGIGPMNLALGRFVSLFLLLQLLIIDAVPAMTIFAWTGRPSGTELLLACMHLTAWNLALAGGSMAISAWSSNPGRAFMFSAMVLLGTCIAMMLEMILGGASMGSGVPTPLRLWWELAEGRSRLAAGVFTGRHVTGALLMTSVGVIGFLLTVFRLRRRFDVTTSIGEATEASPAERSRHVGRDLGIVLPMALLAGCVAAGAADWLDGVPRLIAAGGLLLTILTVLSTSISPLLRERLRWIALGVVLVSVMRWLSSGIDHLTELNWLAGLLTALAAGAIAFALARWHRGRHERAAVPQWPAAPPRRPLSWMLTRGQLGSPWNQWVVVNWCAVGIVLMVDETWRSSYDVVLCLLAVVIAGAVASLRFVGTSLRRALSGLIVGSAPIALFWLHQVDGLHRELRSTEMLAFMSTSLMVIGQVTILGVAAASLGRAGDRKMLTCALSTAVSGQRFLIDISLSALRSGAVPCLLALVGGYLAAQSHHWRELTPAQVIGVLFVMGSAIGVALLLGLAAGLVARRTAPAVTLGLALHGPVPIAVSILLFTMAANSMFALAMAGTMVLVGVLLWVLAFMGSQPSGPTPGRLALGWTGAWLLLVGGLSLLIDPEKVAIAPLTTVFPVPMPIDGGKLLPLRALTWLPVLALGLTAWISPDRWLRRAS
ncbi:MAG: hypothetical protein AAF533_04875 [Acidobacteriota bacterium]